MATCAAQGVMGKLLVMPKSAEGDADPTFNGSSERYSFLAETMSSNRELIGTRAIFGTRSRYATNLSKKSYVPAGTLLLQPGPLEFDKWLPRALGAAESTDVFDVAETLPIFDMLIYRDNGTFHYKNCRVNQMVIKGKAGPTEDEAEIVSMALQIIAMDEVDTTSWPGTIPAVPVATANKPYIFSQGVLTIGSAYPFDEFTLLVDNQLQVRNRNSLKPTCVFSAGRNVRLEVDNPFTTDSLTLMGTLYNTGSAGSLAFTSGNVSTTFTFAHLRSNYDIPTVRGKGEIPLMLKMDAFRTAGSPDITVTNDSTA